LQLGGIALALPLLLIAALSNSDAAQGDRHWGIPDGLIAFSDVTAGLRFDGDSDADLTPAIDLFYSHDFDRVRVLGEFFLNQHEQELERLQVGWLINSDNTGWGGRFHTPLGHWNTQYHHGAHLQTSISRPGLLDFEDEGGIIPLHLTGGLLQGRTSLVNSEIDYEFAIGAGPELTAAGLAPFDVLEPSQHRHGFSYAANISISPSVTPDRRTGAFVGRFELPSKIATVGEAELLVAGLWGLWQQGSLRALAAGFYLHDQLGKAAATDSASFVSGYLQGEWQRDNSWTFYARVEGSSGTSEDSYLDLFPKFTKQAYLGGIRLNLNSQHSLRIEFADRNRSVNDFKEVVLQWTAALP